MKLGVDTNQKVNCTRCDADILNHYKSLKVYQKETGITKFTCRPCSEMNKVKMADTYVLFAWLIFLVSLITDRLGWYKKVDISFADFGSLIVLFGVMAEYILLKGRNKVFAAFMIGAGTYGWTINNSIEPDKIFQRKELFAHITVIFGTLVWGFGGFILLNIVDTFA